MTPLEINKKIAELKGYTVEKNLDNTVKIGRNDGADSLFYNWAENIEDAFDLVKDWNGTVHLFKDNEFWTFSLSSSYKQDRTAHHIVTSAKTPEMAICLVFISFEEHLNKSQKEIEEK